MHSAAARVEAQKTRRSNAVSVSSRTWCDRAACAVRMHSSWQIAAKLVSLLKASFATWQGLASSVFRDEQLSAQK